MMARHTLEAGVVDLWTFRLALQPDDDALLSAEEGERARRFCREEHRRRFIATRAELRRTLSRYTGIRPEKIDFSYASHGKPFVAGGPCFNLSHTEEWAALAVAGFEVGVDIERQRHMAEDIAGHFFAPDEAAALAALPAADRERGFFACWTAKEAVVKALGCGLSMPLDAFSVTVDPDCPLLMLRIDPPGRLAEAWRFRRFALPDGIVGTLAAPNWSGAASWQCDAMHAWPGTLERPHVTMPTIHHRTAA